MFEDGKVVSVESIQTILCTKPHEALTVLQDAYHTPLRQSLVYGQMVKDRCLLRLGRTRKQKDDQKEEGNNAAVPGLFLRSLQSSVAEFLRVVHSRGSEDDPMV